MNSSAKFCEAPPPASLQALTSTTRFPQVTVKFFQVNWRIRLRCPVSFFPFQNAIHPIKQDYILNSLVDLFLVSKRFSVMDLGILFTAFLVLLSHLVPLLSAQEYHQSSSVCPQSFQCSNLGNLSFRYTTISQPDCGLCMVDCDSYPHPKIRLAQSSEQWFYATGKWQESFIWLNDPILESHLNNTSCWTFFYNIHIPNSPISFSTTPMITLFRCNKTQLSPRVRDHFRLYKSHENCEDFNIYYRYPKNPDPPTENPPHECSSIQLPWRVNESSTLFGLLTATFGLVWNVSDACNYGCHLKGGQCRRDEMNNFFLCQ